MNEEVDVNALITLYNQKVSIIKSKYIIRSKVTNVDARFQRIEREI